MPVTGRLFGAGVAAGAARAAYRALVRRPPAVAGKSGPDVWNRTNHRGEQVTLLEGPAYAVGAAAGTALTPGLPGRVRAAAALAGIGAGAFGAYDDLLGSSGSRGFAGHLRALRRGEVTTGLVKLLGIGATGMTAAALVSRSRTDTAINGVVIAGAANLANLFDLRPGRAIKVAGLAGTALTMRGGVAGAAAAAPLGAAGGLLGEDLGERAMLGDAGANALGAALGVAAAAGLSRPARIGVAGLIVALTAASERVSFTKVIEATPALRRLDRLGRRPPAGGWPTPAPPAPETGGAAPPA